MNRSYSKIRHIQNSNMLLESRFINEETNPGGAFLNDAILAKEVNYYPNVDNIAKAKEMTDDGTKVGISTQYNPELKKSDQPNRGGFQKGMGALKFNKDFGIGSKAINLNSKLNITNPIDIISGDIIIGRFDSWGLNGERATLFRPEKEGNDPFAETNYKEIPLTFNSSSAGINFGN